MSQVNIKEALTKAGLTIKDEWESGAELDAKISFKEISGIFTTCGWIQTFYGEVFAGTKQAAFKDVRFGGGHAVLHFKADRIYFVTLNFNRNYRD
ncbi:hypothetical protein [Vibrio barjaei]|uniref:hypothetical protein n=1 Tax=Vibrio barjaei TaxID=1676683 RepID=UPI00228464AB|nr:hypothetical protein [Vibrio barjaei]MCY9874044.1 hypothetical protein [Vibrio barjaei]